MNHLFRYGMAAVGPFGAAGAQFLLSLVLLHALSTGDFGSYSFLLVTSILSAGISTALFGAPLLVLVNQLEGTAREDTIRTVFSAVFAFSAAAVGVMLTMALLLGVPLVPAILFALYAALYLFRWYARSYAYAVGRPRRTMGSDIAYTLALLVGTAAIWWNDDVSLTEIYLLMLVSAGVGMIPFGFDYLGRQFRHLSIRDLGRYPPIWRAHSSWSLVGVVSTEATVNCHAYIVTVIAGPAAFAPVAACALLLRPLAVATNALTEFERAQMARYVRSGDLGDLRRSMRRFRLALTIIWALTTGTAALLLIEAPRLVFPEKYALSDLVLGGTLWMIAGLVRMIRGPESALLQAAGEFQSLARASLGSAGVSMGAVVILLLTAGPIWSVAGLALGDLSYAILTMRTAQHWLNRSAASRRQAMEADIALGKVMQ